MSLDDASRLLIALAVTDWVLTAVIYFYARRETEPALTERAVTSVILSSIATIAAILGAVRLGFIDLDNGVAVGLLAFALILVSAPQIIWAISLAAGRFR